MKSINPRLGVILALTLGASASANAAGVTLYDNIGADPFDVFWNAYSVPGNPYIANQFFATPSMCSPSCALGNISLFMYGKDGADQPLPGGGFQLQIYSNATGVDDEGFNIDVPGSALFTLTSPSQFSADPDVNVFTPGGTFLLNPNTYYWARLSGSATNDGNNSFWITLQNSTTPQSNPDQPGNSVRQPLGGPPSWLSNPEHGNPGSLYYNPGNPPEAFMMKVEVMTSSGGPTVPIPGAVWLMGSSLLGLVFCRRRQAP